jgi:hypothetical protein
MFVLYAVPLALLVGRLLGGRLEGLARLRFRWAPLAILGLAAQLVLFSGPVGAAVGPLGPALYVASTFAVLVAVLRNVRVPGLAVVAVGAVSNLAAILANGGYMPADPGALALAGLEPDDAYSNSLVVSSPALRPLTDVYAMPDAVPFANVFSVGDVLIGIGVFIAIMVAMRGRPGSRVDVGDPVAGRGRTTR